MSINVNEVLRELKNIKANMRELLNWTRGSIYNETDEEVKYEDSPDGRFLRNEYRRILEHMNDLVREIEYLERPITYTGKLRLNANNYYVLMDESGQQLREYHCGDSIEALVYDNFDEQERWTISRMEHDNEHYYMYGYKKTELNGLTVRVRGSAPDSPLY